MYLRFFPTCALFRVRFFPNALFSACALFLMRFFPVRLFPVRFFPVRFFPRTGHQTVQTSVTHETSWREVAQYVLLSADLSLPSLSDISKVDCAGGKFKLLPEYLTERDVWWSFYRGRAMHHRNIEFFVIYC